MKFKQINDNTKRGRDIEVSQTGTFIKKEYVETEVTFKDLVKTFITEYTAKLDLQKNLEDREENLAQLTILLQSDKEKLKKILENPNSNIKDMTAYPILVELSK
jgi:hypothetical protein